MIKMNTFVADELQNKVYHLTKALNQAEQIVRTLEEENNILKKTIQQINSLVEA